MGIKQCFDLLSLLSDLSVLVFHPRVLVLYPRGQLLDLLRNLSDAFEMARLLSFDLTLEFFDLARLLANFSS